MTTHAVSLGVRPCLRIECKFWLGDDGWNGSSEHPSINVQAGSFEQAKSEMEFALGKYIESLLEGSTPMTKEQLPKVTRSLRLAGFSSMARPAPCLKHTTAIRQFPAISCTFLLS
jgi:hypothetical protein